MPKQPAKKGKNKKITKNEAPYIIVSLGTVLLLFLTTFNIDHYLKKQNVLGSSTVISKSHNEIAFWEVFLYENGDYIEGWFELAKLKISEGDINGARQALNEIEKINPNSEELLKLKKTL